MPDAWMPGATRHHRRDDGGAMAGGPPRVVWHTTEGGESARQFRNMRFPSHLVWQPTTGEIVQLLPADRAGRALENAGGGVETNRMGRVCIQIEVVGRASRPFTGTSMRGLDRILAWLDSWDIPRTFPAGAPGGSNMYGPNPQRNSATWRTRGGHYGHSQVPENSHWDPGKIDVDKLLGEDMPVTDADARKIAKAVHYYTMSSLLEGEEGDKRPAHQYLRHAMAGSVEARRVALDNREAIARLGAVQAAQGEVLKALTQITDVDVDMAAVQAAAEEGARAALAESTVSVDVTVRDDTQE